MNTKNFSLSTKMGSSGAWKSYSRRDTTWKLELKFKPLKVPKDKETGEEGSFIALTPHIIYKYRDSLLGKELEL